jgi:hypothetical protein
MKEDLVSVQMPVSPKSSSSSRVRSSDFLLGRFASPQTENCGVDATGSEHDSQRVKANNLARHRTVIPDFGERGEEKSHADQNSQKTNRDSDDSFHFWFFLLSI